jgi:OOP family OmpA-OmpF porin
VAPSGLLSAVSAGLGSWLRYGPLPLNEARRKTLTHPFVTKLAAAALALAAASTAHAAGPHGSPPPAPDCSAQPKIRYFGYAWNAQMGVMFANGGKQSAKDSLMCHHGVNLEITREDSNDNLAAQLVTFAQALKAGEAHPAKGAHFVTLMGDGSAAFLKGVNDTLSRLGPEYTAQVIAAVGFSRGEDKFMGPAAWKADPTRARGGLVAGVIRDGDWNIAMKWLGDHRIKNNPNEKVYDPDALNWVNANDYIEAAQKYVSGFCTDRENVKTRKMERHCVDAVVTWTPGDVTIAEQKGGLVSIVSTNENRTQMPCVVIGIKKWMGDNRKQVESMLAAMFAGGDAVQSSPESLKKAAAVSAQVYGEKDADYWMKYFHIQKVKDKTGAEVELGGSSVLDLDGNLRLFGLKSGSRNDFAQTYTVFGNIVKSQYPNLVPGFYPVAEILDTSFLKDMMNAPGGGKAQ